MSEYLAAAAEKMGMPEALVMRSAQAKAKAGGVTVEDLLREWAGGEAATPSAAPAADDGGPTPDVPATEAPSPADVPEAEAPAADAPVQIVFETLPTPATVTPEEAMAWEQVTTIASDDIRERPGAVIPRWLAAAFVIIPVLALSYLFMNTNGLECGDSGLLASDFEGNLANCDQTAYIPGGGAGNTVVLAAFTEGQGLYAQCAACHGASGEGGVGPAFATVTETFASCSDHVEWVRSGSANWPEPTYGDTAKPVVGGMPGFVMLSEEELAAIAVYERVQFGGESLDDVGVDCGVVEDEETEIEAPSTDT